MRARRAAVCVCAISIAIGVGSGAACNTVIGSRACNTKRRYVVDASPGYIDSKKERAKGSRYPHPSVTKTHWIYYTPEPQIPSSSSSPVPLEERRHQLDLGSITYHPCQRAPAVQDPTHPQQRIRGWTGTRRNRERWVDGRILGAAMCGVVRRWVRCRWNVTGSLGGRRGCGWMSGRL